MDFSFGEKEEALREDIRNFVKEELPQGWSSVMLEEENKDDDWEFAMSIARKLSQQGLLVMNWPKEYGGQDASLWEHLVYKEEVGYWGIPGAGMGVGGVAWVGPSLMLFGTEEQKKKYIPLIAAGESDGVWCTGYSEPNAVEVLVRCRIRLIVQLIKETLIRKRASEHPEVPEIFYVEHRPFGRDK